MRIPSRGSRRLPLGLTLLTATFVAGGCRQGPRATEIIVNVSSDLAVPVDMDSVKVVIIGPSKQRIEYTYRIGVASLGDVHALPINVGLVPAGAKDSEMTVIASALLGTTEVVHQEAVVAFVPDEIRILAIFLGRACVPVMCGTGTTCAGGNCVSNRKKREDLMPFHPLQDAGGLEAPVSDGPSSDAAGADAADRPAGSDGAADPTPGADVGPDASVDGPLSFDPFCSQLLSVVIDRAYLCLGGPRDDFERALGIDRAATCAKLGKSVTSGRTRYTPSYADACLAVVKASTCEDNAPFDDPQSACKKALAGTVAAGGACYDDFDCAGSANCTVQATRCPGVCVPNIPAGSACTYSDRCAYPTTCNGSTCAPYADLGAACGRSNDSPCRSGLYCDFPPTATAGTCVMQKTSGPCMGSQECANRYRCSGGIPPSTGGRCIPEKTLGMACIYGAGECEYLTSCAGDAASGYFCTRWPGVGGSCGSPSGDYVGCIASFCPYDPTGGPTFCKPFRAAGEMCMSGNECGNGAECSNGVCIPECSPP